MKKIILFILLCLFIFSSCVNKNTSNENKEISKNSNLQEKEFVIPIPIDLSSLSAGVDSSSVTKQVLRNINEGIYKYNSNNELILAVAENIEKTDFNDIIIYLKKDIKFHNGKEMLADDVIYSFKRMAGLNKELDKVLENAWAKLLNSNDGGEESNIVKIDDYSLKIHLNNEFLKESASNLENLLADVFIVPNNVSEKEQSLNPIGLGAYKFKRRNLGESISLERFEDYYGEKPDIKNVKFKIYSDNNSKLIAFQSGDINYIDVNKTNIDIIRGLSLDIIEKPSQDVRQIWLNHRIKPFDDIRVRKALNYAIDKKELINIANGGKGYILDTGLSNYNIYYNENLNNKFDYNPDMAKKLLMEAGYENGLSFKYSIVTENALSVDMAVVIKEQLKKVGINMEIEALTWNDYYDRIYKKHVFEATELQIFAYPDAYRMLKRYMSNVSSNLAGYTNSDFDKMMVDAGRELNESKRKEYFEKAQQILLDDAISVFLFDQSNMIALSEGYYNINIYPFAYIDVSSIKVKR